MVTHRNSNRKGVVKESLYELNIISLVFRLKIQACCVFVLVVNSLLNELLIPFNVS